jgi:3,4-dihydroxy 2-butanone 4-phosphate synthase/GTP cyclohydrolase II
LTPAQARLSIGQTPKAYAWISERLPAHDRGTELSEAERVIEHFRSGGIVIVTDDADREGEGDLVMAAEAASTDKVAFYLQHTSGLICTPTTDERCERLGLPAMVAHNQDVHQTAFTVSVDVVAGTTTGISASDRARTIRALADRESGAKDFARPGHVFPLRARPGGVLERRGHTEAAVDLARLAGCAPTGVISEVTSADKLRMASSSELSTLATSHRLPMISVAELVSYRLERECVIDHVSSSRLPTRYARFESHVWRSRIDGTEHLALVYGRINGNEPTLVRVHSECLTGDVFGSSRCDCGRQLDDSLRMIASAGSGVLVYLRGHEGRGIGLANKLAAYRLQDQGHDTVDANVLLGFPVDCREYWTGYQILVQLGVRSMRLLTNNPAKLDGLRGPLLQDVQRVALDPRETQDNLSYLETKRQRMGHLLCSVPAPSQPAETLEPAQVG